VISIDEIYFPCDMKTTQELQTNENTNGSQKSYRQKRTKSSSLKTFGLVMRIYHKRFFNSIIDTNSIYGINVQSQNSNQIFENYDSIVNTS